MTADHCDVGNVPINMLLEEILEIFSYYLCGVDDKDEWETRTRVPKVAIHCIFGTYSSGLASCLYR